MHTSPARVGLIVTHPALRRAVIRPCPAPRFGRLGCSRATWDRVARRARARGRGGAVLRGQQIGHAHAGRCGRVAARADRRRRGGPAQAHPQRRRRRCLRRHHHLGEQTRAQRIGAVDGVCRRRLCRLVVIRGRPGQRLRRGRRLGGRRLVRLDRFVRLAMFRRRSCRRRRRRRSGLLRRVLLARLLGRLAHLLRLLGLRRHRFAHRYLAEQHGRRAAPHGAEAAAVTRRQQSQRSDGAGSTTREREMGERGAGGRHRAQSRLCSARAPQRAPCAVQAQRARSSRGQHSAAKREICS